MEQAFYIHDLNPQAFTLFGTSFHWYWINYLLGYLFVFYGGSFILKTQLNASSEKIFNYQKTLFLSWIGMFIGARLFYIVFYNPKLFMDSPDMIGKFWLGGMSFHGAIFGIFVSVVLINRFEKKICLRDFDLISLWAPIGIGLGRIGNFINGELAGRVTDVSWAVIFPRLYDQNPRHPSQLYESFFEGFLLFIILFSQRKRIRNAGELTSLFIIGYGVFRFFIEFFRLPDKQIGFIFSYFTLGQVFCLVMVVFGICFYRFTRTEN